MHDNHPAVIEAAIRALLDSGVDAGRSRLSEITFTKVEIPKRVPLSPMQSARIFWSDRFGCRYCGERTIPTPIMQLVSLIWPDLFPYHPNWRGGVTHPAIISRSPVVDHVDPGARGGSWSDESNLVTACWPCNVRKGDLSLEQFGGRLLARPTWAWDGLTSLYPALYDAAGRPNPSRHKPYLSAFTQLRSSDPFDRQARSGAGSSPT